MEFAIKAVTNSLPFEEVPKYANAVMLQRYTAVCGHLAYSLEEYQKAMLDFAEQSLSLIHISFCNMSIIIACIYG